MLKFTMNSIASKSTERYRSAKQKPVTNCEYNCSTPRETHTVLIITNYLITHHLVITFIANFTDDGEHCVKAELLFCHNLELIAPKQRLTSESEALMGSIV